MVRRNMYNTHSYRNIFKPFFDSCYKKEVCNAIAFYKEEGGRLPRLGMVCYIYENECDDDFLLIIDKFKKELEDERYRDFFVKRKARTIEKFLSDERLCETFAKRQKLTYEDIVKDKYEQAKSALVPFEYNDVGWAVLLLETLYDDYKETMLPTLTDSNLERVYIKYDKDIYNSIKSNYGLFPIDDKHQLYINYLGPDAKIHDSVLGTFLLLNKSLPIVHLEYLKCLYDSEKSAGRPFGLALLPDYDICDRGMKNVYICYREKEFGSYYKSDLKEIANLSRLYSYDKYEDFWVVSHETDDCNSLTFEEIIGDKSDGREYYKTQVIHLIYKSKDDKYFVNHLDHEFVFYSQEDFNKKLYENKLKGNVRKRIKTFKIDDAKIELTNETSTNIIFRTIHAYFKRHDLVDEYFEKLNNTL